MTFTGILNKDQLAEWTRHGKTSVFLQNVSFLAKQHPILVVKCGLSATLEKIQQTFCVTAVGEIKYS